MKNSGLTIQDVKDAFLLSPELCNADANYYYNTALDWSANGHMRKDWIATIRNFARRDIKDGKLKLSNHRQQGGTNLSKPKKTGGREYGVFDFEPAPMPQSLKEKIANIGKENKDADTK